jgi:cytochrome c553
VDGTGATPRFAKWLHVPGSREAFSSAEIGNMFSVPDWHPESHPLLPDIVAHGRLPDVNACGYCHLPNGQGRPENASLAGLPEAYIVEQVSEFASGRRKSSQPAHGPTAMMTALALHARDAEVRAAARYFSHLMPKPWIRVVETNTVPVMHVAGWMLVATAGAGVEPIGGRIVETPEDLERTELRDDASGFVAYVPVGSIEAGRLRVTTSDSGKSTPCVACHGEDLKGSGNVPPLAGRSPSYIVRQLYDIGHGARGGAAVELMKEPVARLNLADLVAIAAYTASRPR